MIACLWARRKMKKSFEYEVEWKGMEVGVVMISHNSKFTKAFAVTPVDGKSRVGNSGGQNFEETSTDAFGNELTRKERKAREKAKKATLAAGEDWSSDEE